MAKIAYLKIPCSRIPGSKKKTGECVDPKWDFKKTEPRPVKSRQETTKRGNPLLVEMPGSNAKLNITGDLTKPCAPAGKKKLDIRSCHAELVVVPADKAKGLGLMPGPHLRFCTVKDQPGRLVPVANARESIDKMAKFCTCRRKGVTADACSTKLLKSAPLGAPPAKSTGLGNFGEAVHVGKLYLGRDIGDKRAFVHDDIVEEIFTRTARLTGKGGTKTAGRGIYAPTQKGHTKEPQEIMEFVVSAGTPCNVFKTRMQSLAGKAARVAEQDTVLAVTQCANGKLDAKLVGQNGQAKYPMAKIPHPGSKKKRRANNQGK